MIDVDTKYHIKLFLFSFSFVRLLAGFILACCACVMLKTKHYFLFIKLLGKFEKLFDNQETPKLLLNMYRSFRGMRARLLAKENNPIYLDFIKRKYNLKFTSPYSSSSEENRVRLRYLNEDKADREGALLILKEKNHSKGVIYVQYNQGILELAANFDLTELYNDYVVIVEPSSWGYSDLALELLLHGDNLVYVMAQDEIDFNICKKLDQRLIPMRLGAGDWIDLDSVKVQSRQVLESEKQFDVTMIASWRKLKNHKLFFQSLGEMNEKLSVAVVGYPWGKRNSNSVKKEQLKFAPLTIMSLFEQVPHNYVFNVLQDSKVVLMLSEREGANRGIYEALFSGCKVIILSTNRGINKDLVNRGLIDTATKQTLSQKITEALSANDESRSTTLNAEDFSGFIHTWKLLNEYLIENSQIELSKEPLIKSKPNLSYIKNESKLAFDKEYSQLTNYLS